MSASMSSPMATGFQPVPSELFDEQVFYYHPAPQMFPGVPEHLRCRYASKPCGSFRTIKRGGGLHRFCEFHRARANENQWRVDQRRRLERTRDGPVSRIRTRSPRSPASFECERKLSFLLPNEATWSAIDCGVMDTKITMSPEELDILSHLLLSDDDELSPLRPSLL